MSLFLNESDVRQLLTIDLALDAVEESHRALSRAKAIDIPRQRTRLPQTPGSSAYALARIVVIPRYATAALFDTVAALCDGEADSGVQNQYAAALRKAMRLRAGAQGGASHGA